MQLKMWSYDLAREQCPTLDHLYEIASLSQESGYNALGLYLEHRFEYPSTPWAHGVGALSAEHVASLQSEFPSLQIIPMINTLSHMEGFLYTEPGRDLAAQTFQGMMGDPLNPAFIDLCERLVEDTLLCFDSEILHLGGDEASELRTAPILTDLAQEPGGVERLFREHFGPLAMMVLKSGRRPALWADMILANPGAADELPKETLLFDWQYFGGVAESSARLREMGFEVVACPSIQTYNAAWMHLRPSQENITQVVADADRLGLHGVCLTTWECGLMGAYDTLFPAIQGVGQLLNDRSVGEACLEQAYRDRSPDHSRWSDLMGNELQQHPGFEYSTHRSSLKCRFLLYCNPFWLWVHHREDWVGPSGEAILKLLDEAALVAPGPAEQGVTHFVRSAIDFVRIVDKSVEKYRQKLPSEAITAMAPLRGLFDDLSKIARQNHHRIGGSLADLERIKIAKAHVERVIARIREVGAGQLGYLPSFEHLSHPSFVPHDQGAWWRINSWGTR